MLAIISPKKCFISLRNVILAKYFDKKHIFSEGVQAQLDAPLLAFKVGGYILLVTFVPEPGIVTLPAHQFTASNVQLNHLTFECQSVGK